MWLPQHGPGQTLAVNDDNIDVQFKHGPPKTFKKRFAKRLSGNRGGLGDR